MSSSSPEPAASSAATLANFSGRRRIVFEERCPSVGTHSITITVTAGTVLIDGIIVR